MERYLVSPLGKLQSYDDYRAQVERILRETYPGVLPWQINFTVKAMIGYKGYTVFEWPEDSFV